MSGAGFDELLREVRAFCEERDWAQFHNPKDLAISISLESAELLEHFLWQNGADVDRRAVNRRDAIRHEMADVAICLLELAAVLEVDLPAAVREKLRINAGKYPVDKARGSSRKYDELEGR